MGISARAGHRCCSSLLSDYHSFDRSFVLVLAFSSLPFVCLFLVSFLICFVVSSPVVSSPVVSPPVAVPPPPSPFPQEEQYAPLMVRALEKAGSAVPPELSALVEGFKEKVARGEARYASGGFEGKGFTFEATELSEQQRNASLQKRAYEVEQGLTEEGGGEEDEEGLGQGQGPGQGQGQGLSQGGLKGPGAGAGVGAGRALSSLPPTATVLDKARAVANSMCMAKGLPVAVVVAVSADTASVSGTGIATGTAGAASTGATAGTSAAPAPGAPGAPSQAQSTTTSLSTLLTPLGHVLGSEVGVSADGRLDLRAALMRAKAAAAEIVRQGRGAENLPVGGASTVGAMGALGHCSEEFDINDYPVQARRKVTNKNTLDDVSEQCGVAIIARGSYQPPGKKLEEGERRLFLLIQGLSEMQVRQARLELQRMLDEETLKGGGTGHPGQAVAGRYSVL